MEEKRLIPVIELGPRARSQAGAALVVVLLAIVVLLPTTLMLASLAIRWQRQALNYRDTISEEYAAQAGFEEARRRVAGSRLDIPAGEGRSFLIENLDELTADVRISRIDDVVLTQTGRILEGTAAEKADLGLTGVDAEGRVVYQFRKLEIYVVQSDVSRRPTLPAVRLRGVLAKQPDGSVETLGVTVRRGFF